MIHLALYQPEIPQNIGALLRLSACLSVPLHVIGPLNFPWDPHKIRRIGMDYIDSAVFTVHADWEAFLHQFNFCPRTFTHPHYRLIGLAPNKGTACHLFPFSDGDVILAGAESSGLPTDILHTLPKRVCLPMHAQKRSLNLAMASSMAITCALTTSHQWPQKS